ncbi:MAG: class I SAM-dependent methyltransferase [Clostridiales bacterium]|jgi:SAM-dependent methyltransferase|nr:class I SAM-dependent methyltransferase [Clostridiales bacterium]
MNTISNEIWKDNRNYQGFEQRAYRFTDEMRPMFFNWLGIDKNSTVLDAGCGTGVFARYLANGLDKGHITGFDISEFFIAYGRERLKELNLSGKVTLEVDDGFNLRYADDTFDAVTNYTYIGVLSDKEAGMKELIRVCKPGRTVSCVIATMDAPNIWWPGDYPIEGGGELSRLLRLESDIYHKFVWESTARDYKQDGEWGGLQYPKLFDVCGLSEIRMHPYAYLMDYNDSQLPLEYRKNLLIEETESEMGYITWRYNDKKSIYNAHGFSDKESERLIELMKLKLGYLRGHFGEDKSFEWRGGFNYIVTGKKL